MPHTRGEGQLDQLATNEGGGPIKADYSLASLEDQEWTKKEGRDRSYDSKTRNKENKKEEAKTLIKRNTTCLPGTKDYNCPRPVARSPPDTHFLGHQTRLWSQVEQLEKARLTGRSSRGVALQEVPCRSPYQNALPSLCGTPISRILAGLLHGGGAQTPTPGRQ
jgi:hypothetical protein